MIDRGLRIVDHPPGEGSRHQPERRLYPPTPVSDADLALMRRIDELHLDYPFAGSRMLQGMLAAEGRTAGRLHVSTLMKRMGIEALYEDRQLLRLVDAAVQPASKQDSLTTRWKRPIGPNSTVPSHGAKVSVSLGSPVCTRTT